MLSIFSEISTTKNDCLLIVLLILTSLMVWSGPKVRKSCRAWKMLQNENLYAKIGFATAENGSSKILHKNSVLTFGMRIRRKKPQPGRALLCRRMSSFVSEPRTAPVVYLTRRRRPTKNLPKSWRDVARFRMYWDPLLQISMHFDAFCSFFCYLQI